MYDSRVSPKEDAGLGVAGSTIFLATVGVSVIVAGLALGVLRFVAAQPFERGFEGALGAFALGAVVAAPGAMALMALADRPVLLLPAAVVLVPLSVLSFAGVTLPLLIPAIMLFVAYGRRSSVHPIGTARALLTTVVILGLLIAAALALFVHQDPRSYSTPNGGGETSDVISIEESLASVSLVSSALAFGWLVAGMTTPLNWPLS